MTSHRSISSFYNRSNNYDTRSSGEANLTIRYPQFCALARAAEILGERWTLLVIRELLLGPQRFRDLEGRLDGVSPSVLTERLARLEEMGVLCRRTLPPPAGSTVYELTPGGEAVRPAILELIRWGGQFLLPPRPGERLDPAWLPLALSACARQKDAPPHTLQIRMPSADGEVAIHVKGNRRGTVVTRAEAPADLTVVADAWTVLGVATRQVDAREAVRAGRMRVEGKARLVPLIPEFFDTKGG